MSASNDQPAAPEPAPAAAVDNTAEASQQLLAALQEPFPAAPLPLAELRKLAMRLPHLTSLLTGPTRHNYYCQILFSKPSSREEHDKCPTSYAEFASEAAGPHKRTAERVAAVFSRPDVSQQDWEGVFVHLTNTNAVRFDAADAALAEAVAVLIHDSGRYDAAPGGATPGELMQHYYSLFLTLWVSFMLPYELLAYEKSCLLFLRLFLQYHDPLLSVHLDQHQADAAPTMYLMIRHFFMLPSRPVGEAWAVLDWFLLVGDDLIVPFVALASVIAHRRELLALDSHDALKARLDGWSVALPQDRASTAGDPGLADGRSIALLPVWCGKTLLQNATLMLRQTPSTTRGILLSFMGATELREGEAAAKKATDHFSALVCVGIDSADLEMSFPVKPRQHAFPPIEFIIVDCRSQRSFDFAHLPTAVFAGDCISFDEDKMNTLMERLRPLKGTHISLFGTGRAEVAQEDNLLKVIALHLVMRGFPFVSVVVGGFRGVIPLIRENRIRVLLDPDSEPGLAVAAGAGPARVAQEFASGAADALNRAGEFLQAKAPSVDAEAVRERAQEFKSKANEQLAAASAWGWDVVKKAQDRWAALQAESSKQSGEAPAAAGADSQTAAAAAGATTTATDKVPVHPLLKTGGGAAGAGATSDFSLGGGDDDKDEDLGLITEVPVRPLRAANAKDSNAPPAASTAATAAAVAVDTEFEELFGSK